MLLDEFLKQSGGATKATLKKATEGAPLAATPGPATRVQWYLGPDTEILPEALSKYEKQGGWIIEPKWDGMWVMLTVGNPVKGKPHALKSRAASTGPVAEGYAAELVTIPLPLPEGAVLVGELEAASEWSTKQVEKTGCRRLHLFDLPYGLQDYRDVELADRKKLLGLVIGAFEGKAVERFPAVPFYTDKFAERFQEWTTQGLEGCVLKRAASRYRTARADGKTDLWLRCKTRVTEDYVLMALGKTTGGATTGVWGLFKAGKLTRVFQAAAPKQVLQPEYVGKVVCEFMGWARHASGSLRHAQFVRVRSDKTPAMCIHEAKP